jgi:antitoxin (DNA-binding transcriptional repressor) of toxin-antitoxin stability system
MIVTLEEAGTKLAALVDQAAKGEEVLITAGDKPTVKLVLADAAAPAKKPPTFGHWAGKMPPMDLERFRPLTDEDLREEGFELCLPDDK